MDREYFDEKFEQTNDRIQKIELFVENIDHSIRGNGQPGINTRLSLLEKDNKSRTWRDRAIAGCAISSAFGLVLLLIKLSLS